MKHITALAFVTLVFVGGCSTEVSKTGGDDNSADGDTQTSPEAVVKAFFAELKKEKPDKDVLRKLISKEMLDDIKNLDEFIKFGQTLELRKMGKVTIHESGMYAQVHAEYLVDGRQDPDPIPTIKTGDRWYVHTDYVPRKSQKKSKTGD